MCPGNTSTAASTAASARAGQVPQASAISTGQTTKYPGVTSVESTSGPTGSCSRFATFVLAHAISLAWAAGVSRV